MRNGSGTAEGVRKRESGHGKRRCQIVKDVRAAPDAMNHYKEGPLVAPSKIVDIYAIDAGILGLMRRIAKESPPSHLSATLKVS
jgi:hypothetical protein